MASDWAHRCGPARCVRGSLFHYFRVQPRCNSEHCTSPAFCGSSGFTGSLGPVSPAPAPFARRTKNGNPCSASSVVPDIAPITETAAIAKAILRMTLACLLAGFVAGRAAGLAGLVSGRAGLAAGLAGLVSGRAGLAAGLAGLVA